MRIYTDTRTGIKYADLVVSGKRRRVSLKTKDSKVAILRAGKLADDRSATNEGKTLLAAFLARLEDFIKATRKKGTQYLYKLAWRKLLAWQQFKYLDEITPSVLDEYAVQAKAKIKGPNAAGLNRNIRSIKTSMRQAEFWDLIPPQNWRKVSKFKELKHRIEFHTKEEVKQILKILNKEWQLVALLAYRAGLRRIEIAHLKWEEVDFKNNQLYIDPHKGEKYRYIPLDKTLRKALENAKKAKKKEVYVINVGDTTKRDKKDYLSKPYCEFTAELPFKCFLHKLRHTFASHLVQAGVDLYRVKDLMGHSSIQMTERYAHLAPQDLKSAITKLPKI